MKRISEYVSLGHPDKMADYISEFLLDRYLEKDPDTRYAVEVQVKDNHVTLGGEVSSKADFSEDDVRRMVTLAIDKIGYTYDYAKVWAGKCINWGNLTTSTHIHQQSRDIAQGVDGGEGWGDQGIFFGYAEYGVPEMLPVDHQLARCICNKLYKRAKVNINLGWGLDIKTQVVLPVGSNQPEKIIVAIPLLCPEGKAQVEEFLEEILRHKGMYLPKDTIINGTGKYEVHSSIADCGTTGRKLAVDFYGGNCRIGGGSPWTKDGSKADLSLNLFARNTAVKAARRLKQTVTVSLGSCIGKPEVDYCIYNEEGKTLGEGTMLVFPEDIINSYDLKKPIYADMCAEGLFGSGFNWDK